jgi:general secretion pathway protein G
MKATRVLRNSQGMTLIEIMIVLGIIAGLAAVLIPNIRDNFAKSKKKTAAIQISEVAKALDQYALDCNSLPTTEQGLDALLKPTSTCKNWGPKPYIKSSTKLDPWGNELIYERKSSSDFNLMSYGADGEAGGDGLDADISNNEPEAE